MEEENFELLSVEERLSHKSWKARLSAYTTLITSFRTSTSESDAVFRPYVSNPSLVKEWVRDANAVSQEKGVEAAAALVEWSGKAAGKTRSEVLPSVVEKCLGSARAGTRAKAIELCLLYVEVEEDQGEGVIGDIIPGLDVKQPKVVAGCVSVLHQLVALYGVKTILIKPILAVLPKIFGHTDKTVRAEGSLLALALHSFLGPALTPHLADLKPVQQKELGESFGVADEAGSGKGTGKQSRFTRSQQREREAQEQQGPSVGAGDGGDSQEAAEEAIPDAYDFATPVDILSNLPSEFYANLSSAKWKDRKELALEPLLALLAAPRLVGGNYDELTRALGARMADANVVCVALAAACLEKLARGLRDEFNRYRGAVMGPVLARTKEKKASVLDALGAALDAFFYASGSIGDLTEDVVTYAKDKNPSVKAETIKFYLRSLQTTTSPPPKADLVPLVEVLLKALEDSGEPVRVAAAEALGTLMKVVGERALGGQLEGMDDLRRAKVTEAFEKAEVKCKNGASSAPSRSAPAATAPVVSAAKPKPRVIANKENASVAPESPRPITKAPSAAPPRVLAVKKPPVAAAPPPAKKIAPPPASSAARPAAAAKPAEPLKYKYVQEDAEAQAEEILPSEIFKGLADANWKERLAAVGSLFEWLERDMGGIDSEILVRYLSKKPGWKESNFQVTSKMYGIFQLLAEQSPSFAKASAALTIPALSDKLGDIKLKKPAGDALTVFAERSSLQFVLSQAYDPMSKQKAPKAQADSMVWIDQAIRDFGIGGLSVRELIEFLITGLKSTNAAVRTSATKTLVTLKLYVGANITTFLQDLNPALLTTIESEFAKVAAESPPAPTRIAADNAVAAAPAAGGKGGSKAAAAAEDDALDELFPRVDLDKLVSSANANACNDANWKTRKEALESIQSILEANRRLKPSNLPDLIPALKLRMSDSNKIVQGLALDVVARIATGMGKPFDKHSRTFAAPIANILADQKVHVRAGAIATLTAIADAAGLDSLVGGLDKPLESPNPILRKELLAWLEVRFADEDVVATLDLSSIAGGILSCLEDRNVDVRKSATAVLPIVVARAGYNYVIDLTSKLKPASRSTVVPLIEAARGSGAAPSQAKSSAPAPSKPAAAIRPAGKSLRAGAPTPVPQDDPPSRPASVRPPTASRPKSAAPSSRASPVPSSPSIREAPFKSADPYPKQVRASKETGSMKWVIDVNPRPEQVESLLTQMTSNTSPDLLAQLFSKDHSAEKDFVAGLTLLEQCARDPNVAEGYGLSTEEMRARLVANVDVIFKYITLRIGMSSTTITVKCLDLIDHLIPVLDAEGHKLSDYETSALLLSLINKVGDGKETIRQRVRTLFKSLCSVYPFSKVFATILENGLISKNSRTRAESADELGSLFQRHGVSPFPIAKALPLIAKLISDRDTAVRVAALTAIGSAYVLVGADVVYKNVGPLPEKERSMLEERLKRTVGGVPVARTASAGGGSPSRSSTPTIRAPEASPAPSRISAPAIRPAAISRLARPTSIVQPPTEPEVRKPSIAAPRSIPRPSSSTASPRPSSTVPARPRVVNDGQSDTELHRLVQSAQTNDLSASADVLKDIQMEISSDPTSLIPEADHLIEVIVHQMSIAFANLDRNTPQVTLRLCKHLMQTLSAFFDHKALGQAVSPAALTLLLAELTGRLLDTADKPETEAISSLSKVLNMVLIRIFHHSDQSACFSALFLVLQDATMDLRDLRGTALSDRAKYAELVMKCLWKVSKTVKESLESGQLSAPRLLHDIDQFLTHIPPAEWRRRATDNVPLADMPLRTVKTILQQIVSVYGENVFEALDEIQSAESSFVYQYLFRLANSAPVNGGGDAARSPSAMSRQPSTSSMGSTRREPVQSVPSSPPVSSEPMRRPSSTSNGEGARDIEVNQELKRIFDQIGDPVNSRVGIASLYEFRKAHPEADGRIATWMSNTGSYFQTYLKRALDNLASAEQERAGEPLIPLSTPSAPATPRQSLSAASPISPRAPRMSPGSSSGSAPAVVSPGQAAKLQQLQSMFGFSNTSAGRMD